MIRQRRAARVILLDDDDRVLLIRFAIQRAAGEQVFWATPGGGLEGDEDPHAGAQRELMEELGLALPLMGPVHQSTAVFEHEGAPLENTDVFFVARCAASAPRLTAFTEEEREVLREIRWWRVDEIASSGEAIFPPELAEVVRRAAAL